MSSQPSTAIYPLILHVDMDAFFAGVEIRSDPRLGTVPLAVGGGPGKRGVVTAASYRARPFGVRSGMSLGEALRLCPDLMVVPVDASKMIHESIHVLALLDKFCDRVEPASIDEAYLQFPSLPRHQWIPFAESMGETLREAVGKERGLSCSVGAGITRVQAKMASPRGKPGGVTVIPPGEFLAMFATHPVGVIPGVGEKTVEALATLAIHTVGDLAQSDDRRLRQVFGVNAKDLSANAQGTGAAVVVTSEESPNPKSAGHETTFGMDMRDQAHLYATVCLLADRVARRLRRGGFVARTVVARFTVGKKRASRQRRLSAPTDRWQVLAGEAWRLLEAARAGRALRRVGVAAAALETMSTVGDLLVEDQRRTELVKTGDRLRDRFGEDTLLPAGVFLREGGRVSHRRVIGWHPSTRAKTNS